MVGLMLFGFGCWFYCLVGWFVCLGWLEMGLGGCGLGVECGECGENEFGLGCVLGQVKVYVTAGVGQVVGDVEQVQLQLFWFLVVGFVFGQGEYLHPGGELDCECDDGVLDLVLGEVMQWQVGQIGVFCVVDVVFVVGLVVVLQFEVGQLLVGGVGCECCDVVFVEVGDMQLCVGVGVFFVYDYLYF